jgi:hypothetical protein
MSRGLGKLQRAIKTVFAAEPDNALLLSELCERVYCDVEIQKRHRVAIARAVKGIPELKHMRRDTLGGELVIYDPCHVMSYAMARLKADNIRRYERDSDYRFRWNHRSEADFRAMLAPGGDHHHLVEPGGRWFRHAMIPRLRAGGNNNEADQLEAEEKKKLDDSTAAIRAALGRMSSRRRPRSIIGYRLGIANEDGTFEYREFKSRRIANKVARALDYNTVCYYRIERVYEQSTA